MRQLQLIGHGEPSDVIELNTVSEPTLSEEDVLISMEAAPVNPSDFLFVRGIYGIRPAFPSSVGAEGVGRVAKTGSKVDVARRGKRVLILPTYEQGTWAEEVVVPVRNIVPVSDGGDPLQLSMMAITMRAPDCLMTRLRFSKDWWSVSAIPCCSMHWDFSISRFSTQNAPPNFMTVVRKPRPITVSPRSYRRW